jgi:hypothetical protein
MRQTERTKPFSGVRAGGTANKYVVPRDHSLSSLYISDPIPYIGVHVIMN